MYIRVEERNKETGRIDEIEHFKKYQGLKKKQILTMIKFLLFQYFIHYQLLNLRIKLLSPPSLI